MNQVIPINAYDKHWMYLFLEKEHFRLSIVDSLKREDSKYEKY